MNDESLQASKQKSGSGLFSRFFGRKSQEPASSHSNPSDSLKHDKDKEATLRQSATKRLSKPKTIYLVTAYDSRAKLWENELTSWGFTVQCFTESEQAVDKVFEVGCDALLIDFESNNIFGINSILEIREEALFKNLFIGVFVKNSQEGANAVEAGANQSLKRSEIRVDELLSILKSALYPQVVQVQPRVRPKTPLVDKNASAYAYNLPGINKKAISLPVYGQTTRNIPSKTSYNSGRTKVLIIEDNELLAKAYRSQLEAAGFDVNLCFNGKEGLDSILAMPPDVVLLDLFLPGLSGLEVIRNVRASEEVKTLPILVFTSIYSSEAESKARQAGANRFFDKSRTGAAEIIIGINAQLNHPNDKPATLQSNESADSPQPSYQQPTQITTPSLASIPGPKMLSEKEENAQASAQSDPLEKNEIASLEKIKPFAPPAPAAASDNDEFRQELFDLLIKDAPEALETLRQDVTSFMRLQQGEGNAVQTQEILKSIHRRVHSFVGNSAFVGLTRVARLSSALDALLQEFQERPQTITASSQRTMTQAVDLIVKLFAQVQNTNLTEPVTATEQQIEKARILVCDDEIISRRVITHSLEKAELSPTAVDHPQVALDLLKKEEFDLIILDVEMPQMTGFELCKELRTMPQHANTPVLFVTALSGFDNRVKSTLSGGDDFIGKPFSYVELALKSLLYILRGRRNQTVATQQLSPLKGATTTRISMTSDSPTSPVGSSSMSVPNTDTQVESNKL